MNRTLAIKRRYTGISGSVLYSIPLFCILSKVIDTYIYIAFRLSAHQKEQVIARSSILEYTGNYNDTCSLFLHWKCVCEGAGVDEA